MKLITKAEFARLIGVTPGAITGMAKGRLHNALVNNRIDVDHKDVIEFLSARNVEPVTTGIDSLYEKAVILCRERKKCSARLLKAELHIGFDRATAIAKMIKINNPHEIKVNPIPQLPLPSPNLAPQLSVPPPPPSTPKVIREYPENIRAFIGYTLGEIIDMFGSDAGFIIYLKAVKTIEDIETVRLKNAQKSGELASIELIKLGIIDPINATYRTLLTDGAKTIALTVQLMTRSGATLVDCELEVISKMTSFIKTAKAKMKKCLKSV